MARRQPTFDEVYEWAERNDIPAPDAFAVSHLGLAGKERLLRLAAAPWRRRVKAGRTGFPAIDQGE